MNEYILASAHNVWLSSFSHLYHQFVTDENDIDKQYNEQLNIVSRVLKFYTVPVCHIICHFQAASVYTCRVLLRSATSSSFRETSLIAGIVHFFLIHESMWIQGAEYYVRYLISVRS